MDCHLAQKIKAFFGTTPVNPPGMEGSIVMARYEFATHRLFIPDDLGPGLEITLDQSRSNYLVNVLRMPEGGKLLVFNGSDGEWEAELVSAHRKSAKIAALQQTRAQIALSPIRYVFAPIKSARLDFMVQKAVEMGAGTLEPVITRRTQVSRLAHDRMVANVIEAAEQCGILAVPEVKGELSLDKWLAALSPSATLIFCDEDAEIADPVAALRKVGVIAEPVILIGPEGGFEEGERQALLGRANVIRLSLGPRILRADTAAIAALAAVQIAIGDWLGEASTET
jgi:16S rRNA (uracil1498-N3)-methyltransferase